MTNIGLPGLAMVVIVAWPLLTNPVGAALLFVPPLFTASTMF